MLREEQEHLAEESRKMKEEIKVKTKAQKNQEVRFLFLFLLVTVTEVRVFEDTCSHMYFNISSYYNNNNV